MTLRLGVSIVERLRAGHALTFALTMMMSAPAFAQIDVRPFALATDERFAASTTFNAVFGSTAETFLGGGVDVVIHKAYFVDLAISRMSATGQRAFVSNGEVFTLGIPLRATVMPVELTAGYRFRFKRSRVIPYAGAGIGFYSYRETSGLSLPSEDVDVSHMGFVMMAGAEFRVSRWVAMTGDAQYTRVPGILGQGGISKDIGEDNLGGIAGRVRVILGK